MKTAKKLLSVILITILLAYTAILPAVAEDILLPESEHNYANNFYQEWEYVHPEEADYLWITFDEKTYVERGRDYDIFFEEGEDITFEDVIDQAQFYKTGDYISIFDGAGNLCGNYQDDYLAGRTILIPGNSFKITLTTDSNITGYGFKVISVSSDMPEDEYLLVYHLPDGSVKVDSRAYTEYYDYDNHEYVKTANKYVDFYNELHGYIVGNEAIIGWEIKETEQKIIYNYFNDFESYSEEWFNAKAIDGEPGIYNLYAVSTPVALQPEEVYSFTNSSEYFDFDGDRYYLTKENHMRLVSSVCMIGGISPFTIPAVIGSMVFIKYDDGNIFTWNGSCIGFANTVCLQKKGILDVVSTQPGAKCVRDLKPTSELISLLNYYNAQGTTTFIPKNKGVTPGTAEYARQLKNLCASLEAGNLVLLEFYPEDVFPLDMYHGVAATGIYTAPDGSKVILCYDENYDDYSKGRCNFMYVSADYSQFGEEPDDFYSFAWTDDFECYKAIDINEKVSDITPFHKAIFMRIIDLFRGFFENIISFFKK